MSAPLHAGALVVRYVRDGASGSFAPPTVISYEIAAHAGDLPRLRELSADNRVMAAVSRAQLIAAFELACRGGHQPCAAFIRATHQLTRGEALGDSLATLCRAMGYGRTNVAEWLQQELQVGIEEIQAQADTMLHDMAIYGDRLQSLQWADERWGILRHVSLAAWRNALIQACLSGWMGAVEQLDNARGLPMAHASPLDGGGGRADINVARVFAQVCADGFLPAAQWLVDRFAVTPAEAAEYGAYGFRRACEGGHRPMVRWLVGRFGLESAHLRGCLHPELARARADVDARWLYAFVADDPEGAPDVGAPPAAHAPSPPQEGDAELDRDRAGRRALAHAVTQFLYPIP